MSKSLWVGRVHLSLGHWKWSDTHYSFYLNCNKTYLFQVRFWPKWWDCFNPYCHIPQLKINYLLELLIDFNLENVFESLEFMLKDLIVRNTVAFRIPMWIELVFKLQLVLGHVILFLHLLMVLSLSFTYFYLNGIVWSLLDVLIYRLLVFSLDLLCALFLFNDLSVEVWGW